MMEEFFDFDEASSNSHSTSVVELISVPSIKQPDVIAQFSPNADSSCETSDNSHINAASSELAVHGTNRYCKGK